MAKSVPVWLAVAAAVVGLAVGSLKIVDRIVENIQPKKYSYVERYLLVEIGLHGRYDEQLIGIISEKLNEIGKYKLFISGDIRKKISEYRDITDEYCDKRRLDIGELEYCFVDSVFVMLYGIQNLNDIAINGHKMTVEIYNQAESLFPYEDWPIQLVLSESDNDCLQTTTNLIGGGCSFNKKGKNELISIKQPTTAGEALFLPLYYGITVNEGDSTKFRIIISDVILPSIVELPEADPFEARKMGRTPVVTDPAIQEFG